MRPLAFLLAVSLASNVVLVYDFGRRSVAKSAIPAFDLGISRGAVGSTTTEAIAGIDAATWTKIDTGQPTELVARLRSWGYPSRIVRAIVQAQVRERFASGYQAIAIAAAAIPYWRGGSSSLAVDPKLERERRALDRQVSEVATQILGSSVDELSEPAKRMARRQYGDLSSEKLSQMQQIQADYIDLVAEVRIEMRNLMLPEDAAKLAFLEREMRSDVARLLTPQELENVDLRTSGIAAQMRSKLSAFHPTEEEFRAIFEAHQAVESRFGDVRFELASEQRRQGAVAQDQLAFQIEASLGPERYAEYKLSTDPAWFTAERFVTRLGLPSSTIPQLVVIQQDITKRANAVRSDPALTPQQRQLQLNILEREGTSRIAPILGSHGMEAYRQDVGYWLRSLQPTPEVLLATQ
jgi:hypothetical protein